MDDSDDFDKPEIPSTKKRAFIYIGSSALACALIGTFIPVMGPAIGAGLGGIIGIGTVIISEIKRRKDK